MYFLLRSFYDELSVGEHYITPILLHLVCSNNVGLSSVSPDNSNRQNMKEITEILLSTCKSSHPLLCLTMENFADHILNRLRVSADEELFKIISLLYSESYQHSLNRLNVNAIEVPPNYIFSSLERLKKVMDVYPILKEKV